MHTAHLHVKGPPKSHREELISQYSRPQSSSLPLLLLLLVVIVQETGHAAWGCAAHPGAWVTGRLDACDSGYPPPRPGHLCQMVLLRNGELRVKCCMSPWGRLSPTPCGPGAPVFVSPGGICMLVFDGLFRISFIYKLSDYVYAIKISFSFSWKSQSLHPNRMIYGRYFCNQLFYDNFSSVEFRKRMSPCRALAA